MTNVPKDFVMQLGSLATLYVSVAAFLTLIFSTINIAIPDPTAGGWEWDSNQSAMRFSLALLIVFFPTYLVLTRLVNQARRQADGAYANLTKWLVYLSLLAAGFVILIDLVVVITTFLEGELTSRFLLKALAVLLVISAVFYYYLRDAKGYWNMRPQMSITYGAVATAVVIGVVIASFYHLELPAEARERNIDQEQVSDLQEISWRVQSYYTENEALPETYPELFGANTAPEAPEQRIDYEYSATSETEYQLCAEFAFASRSDEFTSRPVFDLDMKFETWEHGEGWHCFERQVTVQE